MYDHILITRFNLKHRFTNVDVNDAQWLDYRFALFDKYCLPSVADQSVKNFTWLVFFDKDLPEIYRKKMEAIREKLPNLHPVYQDEFSFDNIRSACKTYNDQDYLITSRLDSDDVLYVDFIKDVQQLFNKQEDCIINFDKGYYYDPKIHLFTVVTNYEANPFMTYIEKSTVDIRTVFIAPHDQLKTYKNRLNIKDKARWCIIIHESNIWNKVSGKPMYTIDHKVMFPSLSTMNISTVSYFNYVTFYLKYLHLSLWQVLTKIRSSLRKPFGKIPLKEKHGKGFKVLR